MRAALARLTLVVVITQAVFDSGRSSSAAAADGPEAARGIIARLVPAKVDEFLLETIPTESSRDVFEIESRGGKIVVRGSSGVAIASGWNWYLKYYCHCHVSLWGNNLNLPDPLPPVREKVRRVSPFQFRYYLNFCAFSYSLAWWDWPQWERLIDWMALHGINMPLSVTGEEAIWYKVYRDLGLTDKQIADFFAGPGYLGFGWMGCLDGWGGPLPKSWIDSHLELQKKIVARERELGMKPVLQGFTGHVPAGLKEAFPEVSLEDLSWGSFTTHFLHPNDPQFVRIGKMFIEEQTRQFGTDHLYASDTFIEMPPPSNDPQFLAAMSKGVYEAMRAGDPEAVWVMQGWIFVSSPQFWQPPQGKALLGAVPDDRMIVLDLFCEDQPVWNKTEAFYGKPWIWNIIQDFGDVVSLHGGLPQISDNLRLAMTSPARGRLNGIGLVNEGLGSNPVVNEFFSEMAWRSEVPATDNWVRDYVRARYGQSPPLVEDAWQLLLATAYSTPNRSANLICSRPDSSWKGSDYAPAVAPPYDNAQLASVWRKLLDAGDQLSQVDTYRFDLTRVGQQVLNNLALELHKEASAAWLRKDRQALTESAARFLQLIRDMDELLATREELLLGRWLNDAKHLATNDQERRLYEWNARNIITLWGPRDKGLREYANKQWSGMLTGFYLPRWERFFQRLDTALAQGELFDREAYRAWEDDLIEWEERWTHQTEPYPSTAVGDSVAVSRRLWEKYRKYFDNTRNNKAGINLENDSLALKIDSRLGTLAGLENRLTGEAYSIQDDEFSVKAAQWNVDFADTKLIDVVKKQDEIQARYEHPKLDIEVTYSLGKDRHFLEKKTQIAFKEDCSLKEIVVGRPKFSADGLQIVCYRYPDFDIVAAMVKARHGWDFHRPPNSEPNRTFFGRTQKGGFFTGLEMPYDDSMGQDNQVIFCYVPSLKIKAGQKLDGETMYLGVYGRGHQDAREDNSWRAIESLCSAGKEQGGFDGAAAAGVGDKPAPARTEITIAKPAILPLPCESAAMIAMVSALYGPPRHGIKAEGCGCFSQMHWWDGWNTEEELEADFKSLAFFRQCGLDVVSYLRPWGETEKINALREGDRYEPGPQIRRMLDRDAQLRLDSKLGTTFTNTFPWSKRGLPFRLDQPQWLRGVDGKPSSGNIDEYRQQFGNCMGCRPFTDWLEQMLTDILADKRFRYWAFDGDFWGTGGYFHTSVPVTCTADYHDHLPGDSNYVCQKAMQRLITSVRRNHPDMYIQACRPAMDLGIWALRDVDACFTLIESGTGSSNISAGDEIRTASRIRVHHHFLPPWLDQAFLFPCYADPSLKNVPQWPDGKIDYIMLSALSCSPNLLMNLPTQSGIPDKDKQEIKRWLDWGRENTRYLLVRRDLPDWPLKGKVDGSAHIIKDRGLIFLFNPDKAALSGEFALTAESIGLTETGEFKINQEYPRSDRSQTSRYSGAVRWNVPAESAVVLRIQPYVVTQK